MCRRSGCPVATGGTVCTLDHTDLLECPEFEPTDEDSVTADPATDQETLRPIDVRGRTPIISSGEPAVVYSGDTLTIEEATRILRHRPATIIVPIGPVKVGKSTLVGSLWEHVSSTPTDGWTFAGSLTPYGFEERCYLASFESGLLSPEQARTSEGTERVFLHFTLSRPGDPGAPRRDILFADISGEHAAHFVQADEPGPLRPLLRSAHVVAMLVDGGQLAVPSSRWPIVNEARALLRVMVERIELRAGVRLVVVVTKWDKCAAAAGINDVVARLDSELRAIVRDLVLLRTAARSEDEDVVAEGTGLPEFLSLALEEAAPEQPSEISGPSSTRQFSNFIHGSSVLEPLTSWS